MMLRRPQYHLLKQSLSWYGIFDLDKTLGLLGRGGKGASPHGGGFKGMDGGSNHAIRHVMDLGQLTGQGTRHVLLQIGQQQTTNHLLQHGIGNGRWMIIMICLPFQNNMEKQHQWVFLFFVPIYVVVGMERYQQHFIGLSAWKRYDDDVGWSRRRHRPQNCPRTDLNGTDPGDIMDTQLFFRIFAKEE
jgi:hypothetical protein